MFTCFNTIILNRFKILLNTLQYGNVWISVFFTKILTFWIHNTRTQIWKIILYSNPDFKGLFKDFLNAKKLYLKII